MLNTFMMGDIIMQIFCVRIIRSVQIVDFRVICLLSLNTQLFIMFLSVGQSLYQVETPKNFRQLG